MTKDESLKLANDIAVGVDVTKEGTHVVAMRLKPNGVNEVIYSQFHPLVQPEQPEVRTGNCLRVGVCASEGHKIQPQRTWLGLTNEEIEQGLLRSDYALQTAHAWRAGVVFAMTQLKEKNT